MGKKLELFITLFSFLLTKSNLSLEPKKNYINYISYKLNKLRVQETTEQGYIRQVVNKKGDIHIMASEKFNSTHYLRILVIYENKTSSQIRRIDYLSSYNLCGAESFIFGGNSEFIFTTTVISDDPAQGSYDAFNMDKLITYNGLYNAYGYRRSLIKAEPYYYLINLYSDYKTLHFRKVKFSFDSDNNPNMQIVKEKKDNTHHIYSKIKMISCDITKDKNYIFCALYQSYQGTGPPDIWIYLFDSEFEYKSMT